MHDAKFNQLVDVPDIAHFGNCVILGDFIKNGSNSPTHFIDGIQNVNAEAVNVIIRVLPEKIVQICDNFRAHISSGEENKFVQRSIINLDMFDSFMTALPSVRDFWKAHKSKSTSYDEGALKTAQTVFEQNVIKLHDNSGLTLEMVRQCLLNQNQRRPKSCKEGIWFTRSLASRKG